MDARTKEILNRFHESWTQTQNYFNDLIENYPGFERLKPIRDFIASGRQKGDDKFFRLGASMHTLIFSRSVDHGLRPDQKQISIEPITENDFEVILRDGTKIYRQYRISDLKDTQLTKLLETLKHTLVD